MIDPGNPFYIVTLGRRYIRRTWGLVGQNIEHALRFDTQEEAESAAAHVRDTGRQVGDKKTVTVQRVYIEEVSDGT